MKKKQLLIANNNDILVEKFKKLIKVNGIYDLRQVVDDGEQLMSLGNLDSYDVVVVKDALQNISGLYAIEGLLKRTTKKPDLILLLTPFVNEFIIYKCEELGIHYKNDNLSDAYSIFDVLYKFDLDNINKNKYYFDPQYEIINLIKKIGLLRSYLGYTYFEYALNIMFEKSENIYKNMKEIYEIIANHFNVTSTSVEKAMRTCIKSSLVKNDNYFARSVFGYSVETRDFPSTSTFLQVCIKILKEQKHTIINNNLHRSLRKI